MAKEIRWSIRADQERIAILDYWVNRNKSTTYSIKLAKLFIDKVNMLGKSPEQGLITDVASIRVKIIKDYAVYYEIAPDFIKILTIWDTRRNPNKFEL